MTDGSATPGGTAGRGYSAGFDLRTDLAISHYVCPQGFGVPEFFAAVSERGVGHVSLTRPALGQHSPQFLRGLLDTHGLGLSSLNSAGFFTSRDPGIRRASDEANLRLVDAAAELGARSLCVIAGGLEPGQSIEDARARIADGLARLDERARDAGVSLGLEPIHPARLPEVGCVNTIAQARGLIASLGSTGLLLDVHHSWWDPDWSPALSGQAGPVALLQFCNPLLEPGKAPRRAARLAVGSHDPAAWLRQARAAGYDGPFEYEIFAHEHDGDVEAVLDDVCAWWEGLSD